ncbi:Protein of unknown function (DUF3638) domain containing protein [Tylopilus felleus]
MSDLTSKVQTYFSDCYHNVKLKEHLTRVQDILNNVYAQASPIPTPRYSFQPLQRIPSLTSWSITFDQLFARPAPSLQEHANFPSCTPADRNTSLSNSAPLDQLLTTVEANAKDTFQCQYVLALRASAECSRRDSAMVAYGETKLPSAETLVYYHALCRNSYTEALHFVKQHLWLRTKSERALTQSELGQELWNEGCDGWDAEAYPDWLLIQLQGNLLVRPIQAQVACEMISPCSGSNMAMQLNMGEGKSSVIVPIIITVLADGTQLARIIVPKALTAQMFNLLVDRLGGLVDHQEVAVLRNIMSECMEKGGILVVQPEHFLSLKLVSVEKQLLQGEEKNLAELLLQLGGGSILIRETSWTRATKSSTFGISWCTRSAFSNTWKKCFPLGVEYGSGLSGSFPHLRVLSADAGQELISWMVQDILDGWLPNFNFGQLRLPYRDTIQSFISCKNVPPTKVQLVKDYAQQTHYGLTLTWTMLGVPYRAKDVPAQRAEFGHQDVAIILTCLCYYYGGLSDEQLKLSFEILLKQDDPSLDYNLWVEICPSVPECLNRATVDFYISNIVFPREAKEFPSKLSCSGFSGTNDGQYLLPLHITQHDPDHQQGTNAKVLSYLLQPENKHYMCMTLENGERQTSTNASAAIYFNEDDELMVLTRDGSKYLFISSPFAQQLDQCIVYLDDAHKRGTDIKFPSGFRAAVTLGPKVTKDRLAQGCMRMRKLGHGHSLMFFAPLEIDQRIRSVASKGCQDVIDTMDILQWAIHETCDDIRQRAPHWAQQGMDYTSRYATWTSFCSDELSEEELSDAWLQPEAKKLEELYGPRMTSNSFLVAHPDIREHCSKLGVLSLCNVSMDEEQEREVAHEAKCKQQPERPPWVPQASHSIHKDVVAFVKTGIVPAASKAFRPLFDTLNITSAAANEPHIWSQYILATADFEKTVKPLGMVDDYLCPVMWVVSGRRAYSESLIVLSPYKVNKLLPYIRSSDRVHLHLYTPRITKSVKPCDNLALYNIPALPAGWTPPAPLLDQLNVFAGQLYLKDYEMYI